MLTMRPCSHVQQPPRPQGAGQQTLNNMKTSTRSRQFGKTTATVTIREEPDQVELSLTFTSSAPPPRLLEFGPWLNLIVLEYESDPRPLVMTQPRTGERVIWMKNPQTGVRAMVTKSYAVVTFPNRDRN